MTNTVPTGPYRGPGRAEAIGLLERAMDYLARKLGLDPAEVRRRNLLRPEDFPRQTPANWSWMKPTTLAHWNRHSRRSAT